MGKRSRGIVHQYQIMLKIATRLLSQKLSLQRFRRNLPDVHACAVIPRLAKATLQVSTHFPISCFAKNVVRNLGTLFSGRVKINAGTGYALITR